MKRPFREQHLLQIFEAYESEAHRGAPLDLLLSCYFRAHKAVGAKDRKAVAEAAYGIIRWRGLLDHLIEPPLSWEKRYRAFLHFSPEQHLSRTDIPPHVRCSFPKFFFQQLGDSLGEAQAYASGLSCNEQAPTTVRINASLTTRAAMLEKWKAGFAISPCTTALHGITFHKRENFFALPEFKAGLFEVQDEASQLIADLVAARPGDLVLDFCAGSGGKSLAIAPAMQQKGQLFLHDIRASALQEASRRLRRAQIQNAQILTKDSPHRSSLKGKMDWVLVDAPCSGSGTLRRNPDMKWKFDKAMLERLVETQYAIFEEALAFVKPGGRIVYATCSVLPLENMMQKERFLRAFPIQQEVEPFISFPEKGGMDGFFGVVFRKYTHGQVSNEEMIE